MSNVWYTSDLHFFHEKVAKIRGFNTSLAHDQVVVQNWHATVKNDDLVYVLGDIASDERFTQHAIDLLDGLPGRKILIAGNHDPFHPSHRKFDLWQRVALSRDSIIGVAPFARRKLLGLDVMLSHFPYTRDRETPRSLQYRLRNEGAWLLHGHTHGTEVVTYEFASYTVDTGFREPVREIHVGLDAHKLTLVSQDDILAIITEYQQRGM